MSTVQQTMQSLTEMIEGVTETASMAIRHIQHLGTLVEENPYLAQIKEKDAQLEKKDKEIDALVEKLGKANKAYFKNNERVRIVKAYNAMVQKNDEIVSKYKAVRALIDKRNAEIRILKMELGRAAEVDSE
jgi:hypothetical protein